MSRMGQHQPFLYIIYFFHFFGIHINFVFFLKKRYIHYMNFSSISMLIKYKLFIRCVTSKKHLNIEIQENKRNGIGRCYRWALVWRGGGEGHTQVAEISLTGWCSTWLWSEVLPAQSAAGPDQCRTKAILVLKKSKVLLDQIITVTKCY